MPRMILCEQNDLMLNNKGELAKTIQLEWKDVGMETLEVFITNMFFPDEGHSKC